MSVSNVNSVNFDYWLRPSSSNIGKFATLNVSFSVQLWKVVVVTVVVFIKTELLNNILCLSTQSYLLKKFQKKYNKLCYSEALLKLPLDELTVCWPVCQLCAWYVEPTDRQTDIPMNGRTDNGRLYCHLLRWFFLPFYVHFADKYHEWIATTTKNSGIFKTICSFAEHWVNTVVL